MLSQQYGVLLFSAHIYTWVLVFTKEHSRTTVYTVYFGGPRINSNYRIHKQIEVEVHLYA